MSNKLEDNELPAAVRGFVDGWQGGDADKVGALFAENAVVSDQGETHRGLDEIRGWINKDINLFTTTLSFLRAREVDGMVGASYRLEGDFPGGVADLEYQFHLNDDGQIVQLDFAPAQAV
ncbi:MULTISPECIES: nuclear transport factor 2 family protein [unclassified Rathayibacter]|uniref:nuclear transport factor 2 family protein n=1 Tax=unclassified Rathayibacter TaxID=2609250 RepID=UPI00188B0BE5|nr:MULTISPECIES: nuclear transport factor 2 family protein [unclassified Rathayibacter]MBF4461758.1 nuclear transport factor 2 family protein [Rathayibacter sp. VKM Ac-2879]MBF4503170.1 nuclear transport factor 2 family protein [Rathayibacter sp. VKM Ac-2878]